MSTDFSWHTEEDGRWEDDPLPSTAEQPARRRWPVLLLLLAGSLLLGGYLYQQFNQRIETTTDTANDDLMASFIFVQNLHRPSDVELLTNFLSGRDEEWARAQERLLEQGLLFGRPYLGLHDAHGEVTGDNVEAVTISPTLMKAEINTNRAYFVDVGNGLTETIQLRQTAVYRLGTTRWLYAPPEPDFWGPTITMRGQYVTVTYPQRDADLVRSLALRFDSKLAVVCNQPALACPDDLHLKLNLSTNPGSLEQEREHLLWHNFDDSLTLPAPTLVGLPVDEAGYNALYRGYASPLVIRAITEAVQWPCCERSPVFEALVAKQLQQLGLQPWPLTAADYKMLTTEALFLTHLNDVLLYGPDQAAPVQSTTAHALVDFLVEELTAVPIGTLQHDFIQSGREDVWGWLRSYAPAQLELEQAWLSFIERNSEE